MLRYFDTPEDFCAHVIAEERATAADFQKATAEEADRVAPYLNALNRMLYDYAIELGLEDFAGTLVPDPAAPDAPLFDVRQRFIDGAELVGYVPSSDILVMSFRTRDAAYNSQVRAGSANNGWFEFNNGRLVEYDFCTVSDLGMINRRNFNYIALDSFALAYFQSKGVLEEVMGHLAVPLNLFQHDYIHALNLTFSPAGGSLSSMTLTHSIFNPLNNFPQKHFSHRWGNMSEAESWTTQLHRMAIEHSWVEADHEKLVAQAQEYFSFLGDIQSRESLSDRLENDHYYAYMAMVYIWPLTVVFPPHSPTLQRVVEASFAVDYALEKGQKFMEAKEQRKILFANAGKPLDCGGRVQDVLTMISSYTGAAYEYVHACYPMVHARPEFGHTAVFNNAMRPDAMHSMDAFFSLFKIYAHAWEHATDRSRALVAAMPQSMKRVQGIEGVPPQLFPVEA